MAGQTGMRSGERRRWSWLGALVVGVALLRSAEALACPVCFSAANENVLRTYILTAVLMSLVPFGIMAAIGGWLYLRFRNVPAPVSAAAYDRTAVATTSV